MMDPFLRRSVTKEFPADRLIDIGVDFLVLRTEAKPEPIR